MATPQVAGAAALLEAAPPDVDGRADQVGARPDRRPGAERERPGGLGTREGGGLINLVRARMHPLLFAAPTGLSFGMLAAGASATRSVS